jgi:hypothetical protein
MDLLTMGLGYEWLVLVRDPVLVAFGKASDTPGPELAIMGEQTLMVDYDDVSQVERLERMLLVMGSQEQYTMTRRMKAWTSD